MQIQVAAVFEGPLTAVRVAAAVSRSGLPACAGQCCSGAAGLSTLSSTAVQGCAAPKAVLQQCCRAFNLLWTSDSAVQGHAAAVPTQVPNDRKPPVRENSSAIWGQVLGTLGGAPPDPGSNMVSARAAAVCCVQSAVH